MNCLRKFVCIMGLSLVVSVPQLVEVSYAQTLRTDELEALLEKAETADDHLKLAAHYSADAERLEKDGARHQALARRYRRENLPPKVPRIRRGMAKHCESLAQSLRNAAKAARHLAESHKSMAGELQQ